jgi:hypothetical protein
VAVEGASNASTKQERIALWMIEVQINLREKSDERFIFMHVWF